MRRKQLVVISGMLALSIASASFMACSSKENDTATEITGTPAIVETQTPAATEEVAETSTPEVTVEPTSSEEVTATEEATVEPTIEPEQTEEQQTEQPVEELATQTPGVDYSSMSDSELVKTVVGTIETKKISSMSKKERVVYSVSVFNNAISNGIYGYLTGDDNDTVQYIEDSLTAIGATSSEELLSDFLSMTRLDLSSTKELSKLSSDEYAYEIFDEEYTTIAKNEVLTTLLADYIRDNITAFQ